MIKNLLLVGLGGFIGAISRYAVQLLVAKLPLTLFPLSTFVVNIAGSFLIGVLYGLSVTKFGLSDQYKLFLATGFCGSLTTFSTFSLENIRLLNNTHYGMFFTYTMLSLIIGFGAAWAGMKLSGS